MVSPESGVDRHFVSVNVSAGSRPYRRGKARPVTFGTIQAHHWGVMCLRGPEHMEFIVATGIECSAPKIRGGIRRDQLLMSDLWRRYEEDFDRSCHWEHGWGSPQACEAWAKQAARLEPLLRRAVGTRAEVVVNLWPLTADD